MRTRDTTMFMEDYEISYIIGSACICQFFDNIVSSVYSM
jgi:hypothetical protein